MRSAGGCGGAETPRRPRAAVFVSGGGTNLQALLDKRGSVIKSGDIALVVSNKPDAFALQRAKNAGIEAVYLPQNRKDPALFETAARKLLKEREIDVVVLGPRRSCRFCRSRRKVLRPSAYLNTFAEHGVTADVSLLAVCAENFKRTIRILA